MGSRTLPEEKLAHYDATHDNPTLPIMKVLLAVAMGLGALATLIEACGDATSLTACELAVEIASGKRPSGEEEEKKSELMMANVAAIGCEVPTDLTHFDENRRAVGQLANMLQCVLDKCKKQEDQGDKCVAEARLTEAKDMLKKEIAH